MYALILDYAGFTLTTFLFVAFLVRFIFPQTWTRTLIVAFLASLGTRLLFVDFLKTQLPKGTSGCRCVMDLFSHIALGAQIIFTPTNLLFCFVGVLMGTLVGVLPGLGPTAAIALLLPNTFHFQPVSAVIMLAGIYYGAMYGGSTTSILVNIPGEAASVVTCLDGYQMARKGRAGPALGIAAFGSFIAGTLVHIGPDVGRSSSGQGSPGFRPPRVPSASLSWVFSF